jgi:hypothetical protein
MSQDDITQFVESALSQGTSPQNVAQALGQRQLTLEQAAQAVRRLVALSRPAAMRAAAAVAVGPDGVAIAGVGAGDSAADPVEDAAYEAWLLRLALPSASPADIGAQVKANYPNLTFTQIAQVLIHGDPYPVFPDLAAAGMASALADPRLGGTAPDVATALHTVYPALAAVDAGRLLMAPGVFPGIDANGMTAALTAAAFAPGDVSAAVAQLFPPPVQTTSFPPVGGGGVPFDDTAAALANGKPLTRIRIRSGNIVDSIQAFYGDTELPAHGGTGGGVTDIVLGPGDGIDSMKGFWGTWFGGTYVLMLVFRTYSGKTYGPFGDMAFAGSRNPIYFTAPAGQSLLAFTGTVAAGNNGQSQFLGSFGITTSTIR